MHPSAHPLVEALAPVPAIYFGWFGQSGVLIKTLAVLDSVTVERMLSYLAMMH
jgi:hypothetical protein